MSIVQGGNGFPALHPAVYNYMVTGTYLNLDVAILDIPDAGVRCLIEVLSYSMNFIFLHMAISIYIGYRGF